jgi:hypothetical protein
MPISGAGASTVLAHEEGTLSNDDGWNQADEILRKLFTPAQIEMLIQAQEALRGRAGEITLRYTRGGLRAIRYKTPGACTSYHEAVAKLREGGGFGEIVLRPCGESGKVEISVVISREFPLSPGGCPE